MSRHGMLYKGGDNPPSSTYYDKGKFGRLFPLLPPFAADTPSVRKALMEIGKKGGIMDAADTGTPVEQIVLPTPGNLNNPTMTAGVTFLGQFLDHDMTFDPTSSLERQNDPEQIENFRVPLLELDNLYGSGPGGSPHLYDQSPSGDGIKFLVEAIPDSPMHSRHGVLRYDLPRNSQGTALIGDPRNDENLMISQFHLAMLRFHNAAVDYVKANTELTRPSDIFTEAQRIVRWHYQWIIVHEFLPALVGQPLVDDILQNGRKFYKWRNAPFIPVEFSVACYRFGHTQVRPSYRANFGAAPGQEFFATIFNDALPFSHPDPDDLRGGKRAGRRFIDWQTFFDFGDNLNRPNKKIDTKLSTPLFDLIGIPGSEPQSLAQRNLIRALTFRVPSGQSVARAMGETLLSAGELADLKPYHLETRTPLWFYILREADIQAGGLRLGAVGGRIVAEVFIGLLQGDAMSYLRQDPEWRPVLPRISGDTGDFKVVDLLSFAGVVSAL